MNSSAPISESRRIQKKENRKPRQTASASNQPLRIASVHIRSDAAPSFRPPESANPWSEIEPGDLSLWNDILLASDACIYQYPFFNEPQRPLWLRPRYLILKDPVLQDGEKPLAYVCLLSVGFGPAKIGLVFRGPVLLPGCDKLPPEAVAQLLAWARAQGYMFIRFTHSDGSILEQVAAAGDARHLDAFPYFLDYPILSPDYVVEQRDSEAETLAGFDREVRRKIRRAVEAGYEFRCSDSPGALAGLWPLYQECAQRKGFRLERPLSVYMEAMRMARPDGCARLFAVYLEGKPVGSALIFRDRDSAHCMLAAFAEEHRQSAVFLHWNCMRYMYAQGATRYNLGPGPGTLARFKEQFSPQGPPCPPPLTMVLKKGWFSVWMNAIYPVAKMVRPTLRKAVSRLAVEPTPQARRASGRLQPVGHSRA